MKLTPILSLIAAAGLIAGCKSTGSSHGGPVATPPASSGSFDTSSLVTAFKNADIPSNQTVQEVVTALGKRDYSGAVAGLQKLKSIPGLTAAQASSVQGLLGSLAGKVK